MSGEARLKPFPSLDSFEVAACFCLAVSCPLQLSVLEIWQRAMFASDHGLVILDTGGPFLRFLAFSAMFTALTFMFVCLLKTAYAHMAPQVMRSGAVLYAGGHLLLVLWEMGIVDSAASEAVCGLMLGMGSAILVMTWFSSLRNTNYRSGLAAICLIGISLLLTSTVLSRIPETVSVVAVSLIALLAALGSLYLAEKNGSRLRPDDESGSNWWDVFGRFDFSVIDDGVTMDSVVSRALFFVALPIVMLLLFVLARSISFESGTSMPGFAIAGLVSTGIMLPVSRFKTDQSVLRFTNRLLFPSIVFIVLMLGAVTEGATRSNLVALGATVYCLSYLAIFGDMLLVAAGRMRSLSLPSGALGVIMLCIIAMLVYSPVRAGVFSSLGYTVMAAMLAITGVLFVALPGQSMWRMVFQGIDSVAANALSASESYRTRCEAIAEKHALTTRETQVLVLLGHGYTSARVAEELVVADSTVRTHRKNIYRKLGISSRGELIEMIDTVETDS